MATELVFDTSKYRNKSFEEINEDLAGLGLEAGKTSLEKRINPRKLKVVRNKLVIDPKTGNDVTDGLVWNNPLDIAEGMGMINFYNYLAENPNSIVLAASPSEGISPYKEARINIGARKGDEIEFYGIPTKLSPNRLLDFVARVSEFSDAKIPSNPDFLRTTIIPIHQPRGEKNIWDFLQKIAPLDSSAWQYIKKGIPWKEKEMVLSDAHRPAQYIHQNIKNANNSYDFIRIGAHAERMMMRTGREFNIATCAGKFNFEIFASNQNSQIIYAVDVFGNLRPTETFDCPRCEGKIPSGQGITICPHCGARKEDYGTTCD